MMQVELKDIRVGMIYAKVAYWDAELDSMVETGEIPISTPDRQQAVDEIVTALVQRGFQYDEARMAADGVDLSGIGL